MKLFGKKKSPAVAAIEQEIAALTTRRNALQGKLDAANNTLELSRIERNGFLIDGPDDGVAGLRNIDDRIALGERDVIGLRDALTSLDSRLADARMRLELARDGDDREKRATQLERSAGEIAAKAKTLEAAVDALAIAASDFIAAIPADEAGVVIDANGFGPDIAATPADFAAAIIGQGLCMSSPSLFETRKPHSRILRGVGAEKSLSVRVSDGSGKLSNFLPGVHGEEVEILPTSIAAQEILCRPTSRTARALRDSSVLAQAAE